MVGLSFSLWIGRERSLSELFPNGTKDWWKWFSGTHIIEASLRRNYQMGKIYSSKRYGKWHFSFSKSLWHKKNTKEGRNLRFIGYDSGGASLGSLRMDDLCFESSFNVANNSVSMGTQLSPACQQLLGLQSHRLRAATASNELIFANGTCDNMWMGWIYSACRVAKSAVKWIWTNQSKGHLKHSTDDSIAQNGLYLMGFGIV